MATGPYAVPDEFVNGLFKSTATLWQAMTGLQAGMHEPPGSPAGTTPSSPLAVMNTETMQRLAQLQSEYLQHQTALWMSTYAPPSQAAGDPEAASPTETVKADRRFRNPDWTDNPFLNLLRQSYLINSRYLNDLVEAVDVDERSRKRLRFYARQLIDATSPGNSPMTNPDVWKHLSETKGATVMQGMENLLSDMAKGKVSITDETAFEIGRNVATSEGSVVFENTVMQVIQYAPLTAKVASRPLIIVPPCINKYYILDLQPANSFVRYANEQGHTVFLVSWQNAPDALHDVTWDDYIEDGVLKAIDVALDIAKSDKVNLVGWCVGGTIATSALAVMRARGDDFVSSLTLLTTLLDFDESGDLGVLVDEDGVRQREQTIGKGGIYPGQELAFVFQTLRPNDLIWPYVINNYMKGQSPDAFDLLYWNADSTNLAGPMYSWYLRNMYLENNLSKPGRLQMAGESVDLGKVDMPVYLLATQDDHIVPWKSAFQSVHLLGGKAQFVLGASGHIAGVINPPAKNKRSYWKDGRLNGTPQQWLDSATHEPGSWWTDWNRWLESKKGKEVAARGKLGNSTHAPIEPAPGRYVKVKASGG